MAYPWAVSLVFVSLKRTSDIHLLKAGDTGFGLAFRWSLVSLVCGWWGIPWGPIYTLQCLWTLVRGGIDLTEAVLADLPAGGGRSPADPGSGLAPRRSPWNVAPLAALAALALVVAAAVEGLRRYDDQHRPVALVNGLDAAYEVTFDGVSHRLPPQGMVRVEAPKGAHRIGFELPGGTGMTEQSFETGEATIVNPDGTVLVALETTEYSPSPSASAQPPPPRLQAGRVIHTFAAPDYFLEAFPESVSMPAFAGATSRRTRLAVYPKLGVSRVFAVLADSVDRAAAVAYLREAGQRLPGNEQVLALASQALSPDETAGFFALHLETRPIRVAWHRYYQNFVQYRQKGADLRPVYLRLTESNPEDGALAYLYGRLLGDPEQERGWYEKAVNASRPSAYGHFALAFLSFGRGDFAEALAALERCRAGGLEAEGLRELRVDSLVALGRFDDAIREHRRGPIDALNVAHASVDLELAYLVGGADAARAAVRGHLGRIPGELGEAWKTTTKTVLEGRLAYCAGDYEAMARSLAESSSPADQYTAALCRGDFAGAAAALEPIEAVNSHAWLVVYLAARLAGHPDAEDYWRRAMELASGEPGSGRRVADHFRGVRPLANAELLDMPMRPGEKRVFLAALGLRDPELRQAALERAERYNRSLAFPRHLVSAALAGRLPR